MKLTYLPKWQIINQSQKNFMIPVQNKRKSNIFQRKFLRDGQMSFSR